MPCHPEQRPKMQTRIPTRKVPRRRRSLGSMMTCFHVHVHVQLPSRQDARPPVPWRHNVEGAETCFQDLPLKHHVGLASFHSDARSFRVSLGFPQENRSANSREKTPSAVPPLHIRGRCCSVYRYFSRPNSPFHFQGTCPTQCVRTISPHRLTCPTRHRKLGNICLRQRPTPSRCGLHSDAASRLGWRPLCSERLPGPRMHARRPQTRWSAARMVAAVRLRPQFQRQDPW
jgi:hypothetical protein